MEVVLLSIFRYTFRVFLYFIVFMFQVILFDIDGVAIRGDAIFSERLSKDFHISMEKILPFFQNEFPLCRIGKADLKQELTKYLVSWKWKYSVDDLINYWLRYEGARDERVIDHIRKLRAIGIKCYFVTDNESYRTRFIENEMMLKKESSGIFSSCDIGYTKSQMEFWQEVYIRIGSPDKKNALVWDDDSENLEVAKKFGFQAQLYVGYDRYASTMKQLTSI